MIDVQVHGLDELEKSMQQVIIKYPRESKKRLRKIGRLFVKEAKKKCLYKRINKMWKVDSPYAKSEGDITVQVWNSHKLHHLYENGWEKKNRKGESRGFRPGEAYTEETAAEFNRTVMPEETEKFINEILEGDGL